MLTDKTACGAMSDFISITEVRKGDIVRFNSYALRVEAEPKREGAFVVIHGRQSINGCPLVTKRFNSSMRAHVDRVPLVLRAT